MKNVGKQIRRIPFLVLCLLCYGLTAAQSSRIVRGTVVNVQNQPVMGASVYATEKQTEGTATGADGTFSLNVSANVRSLTVTLVGMVTQQVAIPADNYVRVTLQDSNVQIDEVVVVGYGQQTKASVVGAITQTSGEVLERAGGVTNIGAALTGQLPGVITYASTGMPGEEDPRIIIRAQSTWNNSDPLVLVDGIERSLNTIDISTVESISVLKDASATAVYGVKGANGVILVTTRRGVAGRATVNIRANMTAKAASKLPKKYDAYDTFLLRNQVIEREYAVSPGAWASAYKPMGIIEKYRNPANDIEWDQYPNVDWEKELFRDFAMSYNAGVNVSGGSDLVNYFVSTDYLHEGDLFKTFQNNRGYHVNYGFSRINVRSNLDFNITRTTKFSMNLFGSNGARKSPRGAGVGDSQYWASAYRTAPDAMRPIYSNGMWGWYAPRNADVPNSVLNLAVAGTETQTTTNITTDFILEQKLDFITKGFRAKGTFSYDNRFVETGRGISDTYNYAQRKWVDPDTGVQSLEQPTNAGTQMEFAESIRWTTGGGSLNMGSTYRRTYYQLQLYWGRQFGKHDITAMTLFSREQSASGSNFPNYREDWAYRLTYNYRMKYFAEINGAYNGSQKFGPGYRFEYFPSYSAGWMLSEEPFLKKLNVFDMLKLRGSYGKVGSDSGGAFLYADQWASGGNAQMGSPISNTPYSFFQITRLGNPDISWEVAEKKNFGVDYSFLKGLVAGSVDVFGDRRTRILLGGGSRAVPSYFGATAPTANVGEMTSRGYEFEVRLNYVFRNGLRLWANGNATHAENKVVFRDEPELRPAYQKSAGHILNQNYSYIDTGYIVSWDDLYGSTVRTNYNASKFPGDYNIIDFNGDGTIDTQDSVPYGYAGTPQNTYNATLGFSYKGFSAFVQFYGVSNVTREVTFPTFHSSSAVAYVEGTYYTLGQGGQVPLPHWSTSTASDANGRRFMFDGSYLRLKNAEISYTFDGRFVKRMGMKSCRLFLNGDNLLLWTDMPDDRESNFTGGSSMGAYPTVRRFNFGINITL